MGNRGSGLDEPVSTVTSEVDIDLVSRLNQSFLKGNGSNVLKILNTGGGIVEYLGSESKLCEFIDNGSIKMKFFAGGAAGQVADIEFPGIGTRKYVVKATKQLKEIINVTANITVQDAWDAGLDDGGFDYKIYLTLNGGDPYRLLRVGDAIIIPAFAQECLTASPTVVQDLARPPSTLSYPAGSYICPQNSYSEYVNSLLAGELIRSGQSIHFINTFNFATCSEEKLPQSYVDILQAKKSYKPELADRYVAQYTFMEKVDTTLKNIIKNKLVSQSEAEKLFVQITHAIAVYQSVYKLQHGDLHVDNVFISQVTSDTQWQDKKILGHAFYKYRVGNTELYLPATSWLAKIADWGLSVKYSTPIVGDGYTIFDGYDQQDGAGPWIPNFYNETYDLLFIFNNLYNVFQNSAFFKEIKEWFVGSDSLEPTYINPRNTRPVLAKLIESPLKGKTPLALLQSPIFTNRLCLPSNVPNTEMNVIELGYVDATPPSEYNFQDAYDVLGLNIIPISNVSKPTKVAKSKPAQAATKSKAASKSKGAPKMKGSAAKTKALPPTAIDCELLSSLNVTDLANRLAPLKLTTGTVRLFNSNRVNGQALLDFYEIDKLASLGISNTDRTKLTTYLERCISLA